MTNLLRFWSTFTGPVGRIRYLGHGLGLMALALLEHVKGRAEASTGGVDRAGMRLAGMWPARMRPAGVRP